MSESFEQGMKIFHENLAGMYANGHMTKWADADTSVDLDRLQEAHDHEIERIGKTEYHRGYEDGRRSMDAEHYAVALRLRALPLDGCTQENLSQIARAVWHSDFGWTEDACKALRDELVRLLGGVSDEPHPNLSRTSAEPDGEITITAELRERIAGVCKVSGLSGEKLYGIADRIDEQFGRICMQQEAVLQSTISELTAELDELQAKLDEAEFAIANWREREKSFDASERLREELRRERDELRERLEENEEALSRTAGKLAMAEVRLRDAQAKLDVLEENGLTLMHRTLKNMLGEAKNAHDVLCAKVEAMPSFDRERKRLMRAAENSERRCSELLDLLRDAAEEFKALMEEKDTYANERKA